MMGDELDKERVGDYLRNHRGFLEEHVLEHVDVETLERWLIRRSQRDKSQSLKNNQETARRISLSRWKVLIHSQLPLNFRHFYAGCLNVQRFIHIHSVKAANQFNSEEDSFSKLYWFYLYIYWLYQRFVLFNYTTVGSRFDAVVLLVMKHLMGS